MIFEKPIAFALLTVSLIIVGYKLYNRSKEFRKMLLNIEKVSESNQKAKFSLADFVQIFSKSLVLICFIFGFVLLTFIDLSLIVIDEGNVLNIGLTSEVFSEFVDKYSNGLNLLFSVPISLAGSFVAILLAQRAVETANNQKEIQDKLLSIEQDRNRFQTKVTISDLLSPIKNDFDNLSMALSEFVNSIQIQKNTVQKFLPKENVWRIKKFSDFFEEKMKDISKKNEVDEFVLNIKVNDDRIIGSLEKVIKVLKDINKNTKSLRFFDFQSTEKMSFNSGPIYQFLQEHKSRMESLSSDQVSDSIYDFMKIENNLSTVLNFTNKLKLDRVDINNQEDLIGSIKEYVFPFFDYIKPVNEYLRLIDLAVSKRDLMTDYLIMKDESKFHLLYIGSTYTDGHVELYKQVELNGYLHLLPEFLRGIVLTIPNQADIKAYIDKLDINGHLTDSDKLEMVFNPSAFLDDSLLILKDSSLFLSSINKAIFIQTHETECMVNENQDQYDLELPLLDGSNEAPVNRDL
jgi:hypothetical protein